MKKLIALLIPLLVLLSPGLAQDDEVNKEFSFENESNSSDIRFEVGEDATAISLSIVSTIDKGTLKISLINPKGDKEGGFHLQTSKGKKGRSNSNSNSNSNSSTSISTGKGSNSSNASSISISSGSNSGTSTSISTGKGSNSSVIVTNGSETSSSVNINSDADNSYSYNFVNATNASAKGNMTKVISNPEPGTWIVKIEPKKVFGNAEIKIRQD